MFDLAQFNNYKEYNRREVKKAMLRDQTEDTMDMKILKNMQMDVLNMETVHAYRKMRTI